MKRADLCLLMPRILRKAGRARREPVALFGTGFGATMPAAPNGQLPSSPLPLMQPAKFTIGDQLAQVTFRSSDTLAFDRSAARLCKRFSLSIQANAMQQVLEPRIGAYRIKSRPQEHSRVKSLRVTLFEPRHRLIPLVQTHINQGNLGSI